jgi:hypothetical protein
MIGLTKNELKIFKAVDMNPLFVAAVVRKVKMPRMTVYTVLLRLKKQGLVKSVRSESGKRLAWCRSEDSRIEQELGTTKKILLGSPHEVVSTGHLSYSGKKEVADALMHLTTRKDGARMYSIQSSKNWQMWLNLMGKEWVNKHNRAVVKHKLVALTVHSPEAPDTIKKDKEITEAYKGRLGNSHAVPEEFLARGLSLYIFEDTILLVDLEKVEAASFTDHNMAKFLIKMFSFMFEQSEREEFFQKFNR